MSDYSGTGNGLFRNYARPATHTPSADGLRKVEHRTRVALTRCPDCGAPTVDIEHHKKEICARRKK